MGSIEQKITDIVQGRQIVFWGAGKICQRVLLRYKELEPVYLIDKFCEKEEMYEKEVKRPDEIEDWSKVYVIITCLRYEEIEQELKTYGLEEQKDFDSFRGFLGYDNLTILKGIDNVKNKVIDNPSLKSRTLIMGHVWDNRNAEALAYFYSQYVKDKNIEDYVLLARLGGDISEEEAKKEVGFEVINKPTVCNWSGHNPEQLGWGIAGKVELTEDEEQWLDELESIKRGDVGKEVGTRKVTESIYLYYREIVNLLEPKAIVIWGGWQREAYILKHLAEIRNIPYGFMEHGWIPGTLQFDKGGIAGQSEYVRNSLLMKEKVTTVSREKVREVLKYVTDTKLDTGNFEGFETEEELLDSIDLTKKTIFLVGMDDFNMSINPSSDYWKNYVSHVVDSTQHAFELLDAECSKNNWNLVYKPHPCRDNLNDRTTAEQRERAYAFYKMPVDRLIEKADVIVSLSSAVEYKALMYGKALVQIGTSSLSGQGCTYEIDSIEDVGIKLTDAVNKGMTETQKDNFEIFIAKLLDNYLWDDLSDRSLRYGRTIEKDFFE